MNGAWEHGASSSMRIVSEMNFRPASIVLDEVIGVGFVGFVHPKLTVLFSDVSETLVVGEN